MTKEFITPYTPDTTEEQAFNSVLYESGLSDYLDTPTGGEHTKRFKITLTVEEDKTAEYFSTLNTLKPEMFPTSSTFLTKEFITKDKTDDSSK